VQRFTITKGATSQIIPVSIYDSSSTTGAKLAGLVYNSAGLTAYYYRQGAGTGATAITLATATLGTYSSGGFVAIDGTNMPGDYELHLPNAVLASGANNVIIQLKGATNMVPVNIEIDLTSVDLQDSVRGGMTALPNAAAGAAGGLPTDSTGKTSFNDIAATAIVSGGAITTSGGAVSTVSAVSGAVGSVTGAVGSVTGNVGGIAGTITTLDALNTAIPATVWDTTAASHITAGTTGAAQALGSAAIIDTTVTGTPTTTTFDFTGGSTTNNFYADQELYFLSGTGIGQGRTVLSSSYSAGTTTITVDEAFAVTPAAGDRVAIRVAHNHPITQIANQVWSTSITEPTGVFAWTGNTQDILQWLGVLARNKMTQTATTQTLRNDGDTANVATSTVSDDGTTFTRAEWI